MVCPQYLRSLVQDMNFFFAVSLIAMSADWSFLVSFHQATRCHQQRLFRNNRRLFFLILVTEMRRVITQRRPCSHYLCSCQSQNKRIFASWSVSDGCFFIFETHHAARLYFSAQMTHAFLEAQPTNMYLSSSSNKI